MKLEQAMTELRNGFIIHIPNTEYYYKLGEQSRPPHEPRIVIMNQDYEEIVPECVLAPAELTVFMLSDEWVKMRE